MAFSCIGENKMFKEFVEATKELNPNETVTVTCKDVVLQTTLQELKIYLSKVELLKVLSNIVKEVDLE